MLKDSQRKFFIVAFISFFEFTLGYIVVLEIYI